MAYSWVDTPHIFETPFYVISYITSMLTSLELLERSQTDFDAAADAYLEFTAGTSDHSYCELIKESGLSDVFSEGAAERILNSALDYLEIEAANGVDFKDTDGHWFEDGAQTLSACGIVKGSDGYFEPEAAATRAMLAAEMYRMSGSPALEDAPVLSDVSESDWYCAPARWAAQAGFLPAEDGKFNPDAAITREELAQAIMLACGGDGTSVDRTVLDKFTDVSEISEDARAAFAWAVNYGIILGNGDKLEPAAVATRAEVGQILMRIL